MVAELASVLHVGHGQELTFAGYLYRVALHFGAIGVVGLVLFWYLESTR